MALPIHSFQTGTARGSPVALWFYKTDPGISGSAEYSVNVGTIVRIETTSAHSPVTITFSQGNVQILSGDPATSFISDLTAFEASGGTLPVSTGDGLTWTLILQILSNSPDPFGDFGDRTASSRLFVGVPESSLNIIGRGYFKSFGVDIGEEGIRGGLFTSIGGVTLAAINDGEPGHHMGVAIYALGIRHNTSDDGVAALGGDSYNDSGGNAIGVHGYTSSIGVPASSLYDFYAFHNDGSCTGISAGFYSATQAGTSSSLNAAFYAEDQGTGANDYAFYSAGGKSQHLGQFEINRESDIYSLVPAANQFAAEGTDAYQFLVVAKNRYAGLFVEFETDGKSGVYSGGFDQGMYVFGTVAPTVDISTAQGAMTFQIAGTIPVGITHSGQITGCYATAGLWASKGNLTNLVALESGVTLLGPSPTSAVTTAAAFIADGAILGAGYTVANNYGIIIRDQHGVGGTLNHALHIDDQSTGYAIYSAGGKVNISSLPAYASNAAALVGGLISGDLYRLGDTIGVVH